MNTFCTAPALRRLCRTAFARQLTAVSLIVTFCWLVAARPAVAETWAQRLGYPADATVVILEAVEAGVAFETNDAIRKCFEHGVISSAAVQTTGPWFEDFAAWHREHSEHSVGVQISLNSPFPNYRWRPLSGPLEVASLVDEDGYFYRHTLQTHTFAQREHVEREIIAQIEAARKAGLRPSHVTPFMGMLVSREDLFELYLDIAQRYWIPAVMVELTPALIERFEKDGVPLNDDLVALVQAYPLPKLDDIQFVPMGETYEATRQSLIGRIGSLPPGLIELLFMPATHTPALERIAEDWERRTWETRLLADPQVRAALENKKVILTNWTEIMRRFERR